MTAEPTSNDKQITIAVPAERVAEFYAFFGRFLAGHTHRRGHARGHRCGGARQSTAGAGPHAAGETQTA